jgi:hypothetical protein
MQTPRQLYFHGIIDVAIFTCPTIFSGRLRDPPPSVARAGMTTFFNATIAL